MQRWSRYAALGLSLFVMGALTSCGDDGAGPDSGDRLSVDETQALLEVILGGAFMLPDGSLSMGALSELNAGSPPIQGSFDETAPCDQGGTIRVAGQINGNIDDVTGNGNISMDANMVHSGCKGEASNGVIFTISGNPNIGMDLDITMTDESFAYAGALNGSVRWSTSTGKQGTCGIDVQFQMQGDLSGAFTGSSSGTACRHDMSQTF